MSGGYLLQGRVNRVTRRKQFAVRSMKQSWLLCETPTPTLEQVAKLDQP